MATTTSPVAPADQAHWTDRVRSPGTGERRNLLRELRVSREAQARAAADTADMQSVFEVLENFPVADALRAEAARNRFVHSAEFVDLYRAQSLPDLSNDGAAALLALPEGTLGHEYAVWFRNWGLDNSFGRTWQVDSVERWYAYRYAHLHDLLHFVLGYAPYDKSKEMEIEAFLFAQTRALNHLVFIAGFFRNLRRSDPTLARQMPARLLAAHRRGAAAANVMLVRWEDLLDRPLDEVRRELRIDDVPAVPRERTPIPPPTETPLLAHAVLNVPDMAAAERFYTGLFGLEVSARDDRLGVVFLTDGRDHHTFALGRSWPRGPLGPLKGLVADAGLVRAVLSSRRRSARAGETRKVTVPPLRIYLERLRPGLNHLGYRVSSEQELVRWYHHLKRNHVRVDWVVNHGDLISGIYFRDPAGMRCEIFCDGTGALEKQARREAGASIDELREDDFHNWELDLETLTAAVRDGGAGR